MDQTLVEPIIKTVFHGLSVNDALRLFIAAYLMGGALFIVADRADPRSVVNGGLRLTIAALAAPVGPLLAVAFAASAAAAPWRANLRQIEGYLLVLWAPAGAVFFAAIYLGWLYKTDLFFFAPITIAQTPAATFPSLVVAIAASPLLLAPFIERRWPRRADAAGLLLAAGAAAALYGMAWPIGALVIVLFGITSAKSLTAPRTADKAVLAATASILAGLAAFWASAAA